MNKTITTRKPHQCHLCGLEIPKGTKAEYYKGRDASRDEGNNQVGIEYFRFYIHFEKCPTSQHLTPKL